MDTLRSTLQPLTHSLPPPITSLLTSLLGPTCYRTLILDLSLTSSSSSACLKLLISKLLSIGILTFSSIVKVPQIIKLASSHSSTGISFASCLLETVAYLISLAYSARSGFPFSTYGETALIAVQDAVIGVLVLRYQGRNKAAAAFVLGVAVAVGGLMGGAGDGEGVIGMGVLRNLQAAAGVLAAASKGPQIWTCWRQGGTGQLSAFAVFTYLLGSLARVFTTWQEVDDTMILYQFIAGFVLNAVLAAQMAYYWKSPATASHAAEMGKEPEKIALGSSTATPAKGKGPTTRRRG